jgi:hypothetical protein
MQTSAPARSSAALRNPKISTHPPLHPHRPPLFALGVRCDLCGSAVKSGSRTSTPKAVPACGRRVTIKTKR